MTPGQYTVSLGVGSLLGALGVAEATGVQEWTVLGLLAAVVLGIGGRLIAAVDKQAAATSELVTEMRLQSAQQKELIARVDRLASDINDVVRKSP